MATVLASSAVVAGIGMPRFHVNDGIVTSTVTSLLGFSAVMFTLVRTSIATASALKASSDATDQKTEEVKQALLVSNTEQIRQLGEIQAVGETTHTLVNSQHGLALRSLATALAKIAEISGQDADKQAALDAESIAQEHERKQSVLDQGKVA